MRSKEMARPGLPGGILFTLAIASIVLLTAFGASVAAASTGGAPTPSGSPPPPSSPAGAPTTAPSAGTLSLVAAETTPRKSFYFGFRFPRVSYTISSSQPQNDLVIEVVNEAGEVVKTFYRNDVAPDVANSIRWDGTTNEGKPARNGRYSFRIGPQTAEAPAARRATQSTAPLSLSFDFYGYAFPILGAHEYGSSMGRFGAGRSGHTHQGQDVMAACGTPLVAARGGVVQFAGYHAAAGNYLVIDGKGTGYDFMYAHLAEPTPLQAGETVRTGQPIGIVGDTGSASGCHLHFEMWGTPGWYEGGSPIDPLGFLQKWDAYS
ncbi:MAG TPA: peptidoglycan DD-metalloendopeptidase family protein [Solirubrobacterales bacterium]|nr:peptidoglycan DD-metalloendopeptidase family protein [Solirubrobacterales bacterium]